MPRPRTTSWHGSFLPSKRKTYKLATAPPRKPKRVGWVISSLARAIFLKWVSSFIRDLASLLEMAGFDPGDRCPWFAPERLAC